MKSLAKFLLLSFLLLTSIPSFALLSPQVDSIPMRDGKKLAADVYIPLGMNSGPVILVQTPYNRLLYRIGLPLEIGLNINSSNYIIVVVDWRGFYGSRNAAYTGSPTLGQDGHDCVEWIATQSWSNGKIGTWGPSALGRVQFQTAETNPPHLICICPVVSGPQYSYNEYFPNGDLRTEYVEQLDALGFGLSTSLMANPVHNLAWSFVESANFYPDSIRVPCYMIGGWYDHTIEDMLSFFSALQTQSPVNVRNTHRLLMGPWVHGGHGIAMPGSATQGQLSYPNAANWDDSLALVFFDYHLRNIANGWDQSSVVQYYQMGDDIWQTSPAFPPTGITNTNFYFHENELMNTEPPLTSGDSLSINYNPNDPSPTIGGPTLQTGLEQGPYDQKDSVESRNDILIFSTDVLTQNVVMKGNAVVHLKVSSKQKDTDFDIRLTDVYPDGRSMLVNDGCMRMRFRRGTATTDTSAIVPGQVYDCVIKLPSSCITFLAGHKIRVDVTSSNYPRFNRNANTDGNMYPGKSLDSLLNPVVADNSVYINSVNASYVSLPLEGYISGVKNVNGTSADLVIYPNPANQRLTVNSKQGALGSIEIKDSFGRILIVKNEISNHTNIDISSLAPGVYFISLQTPAGNVVKKVVKE